MNSRDLERYTETIESLNLDKVLDYEQFNRIAIVHHSSAIEGSTLTLEETTLLINEGITARGKSMNEHLMVKDHYEALLFILNRAANLTSDASNKKMDITSDFLKQINALVNKNTGQIRNTVLGICDDSKGDFRLGNVSAGTTYFVNYDKVESTVKELCLKISNLLNTVKTNEEIYQLSFDAHFYLVSIHPWFDGNGRAPRLLMNYIQSLFKKPLSIVFLEDKPAYIKALNDSRDNDDVNIFREFMLIQHLKYLKSEIEKYEHRNKGFRFLL
jgi:Fic family protein